MHKWLGFKSMSVVYIFVIIHSMYLAMLRKINASLDWLLYGLRSQRKICLPWGNRVLLNLTVSHEILLIYFVKIEKG